MGDVIHALPVVQDLRQQFGPDFILDWAVETSFSEIPAWHPGVDHVIALPLRALKKKRSFSNIKTIYHQLRARKYDHVLDLQGNLKSALLTRSVKASHHHGYDRASLKEWPAALLYGKSHAVARDQHAVTRMRQLAARAMNYPVPGEVVDFGIDERRFQSPALPFSLPENYVFFTHNATWETKLWPESHWGALIKLAVEAGYAVLLPSGNNQEAERALRLAANQKGVFALPRLTLSEVAWLIRGARALVATDTGLAHLAGALNRPQVVLYGPTDARWIGTLGAHQLHLQATLPCTPCYRRDCAYQGYAPAKPFCLAQWTPQQVWQLLQAKL